MKTFNEDISTILKIRSLNDLHEEILFFNSADPEPFLQNLSQIIKSKKKFIPKVKINPNDLLESLRDKAVRAIIESSIEELEVEIKHREEFNECYEDLETYFLKEKKLILEVMIGEKGESLETILILIQDMRGICRRLAKFFLTKKPKPNKLTLISIVHGIFKKFNENDKGTRWDKKRYIDDLIKELTEKLPSKLQQALSGIVIKELKKVPRFNKEKLPSFPLARRIDCVLPEAVFAALYGTYVGGAMALIGTAFASTGIGLAAGTLMFALTLVKWDPEKVVNKLSQEIREQVIKEKASHNFVVSTLLKYCEMVEDINF